MKLSALNGVARDVKQDAVDTAVHAGKAARLAVRARVQVTAPHFGRYRYSGLDEHNASRATSAARDSLGRVGDDVVAGASVLKDAAHAQAQSVESRIHEGAGRVIDEATRFAKHW